MVTHHRAIDNRVRVGISALHLRPGASGSHEPYLVRLVSALASEAKESGVELVVVAARDLPQDLLRVCESFSVEVIWVPMVERSLVLRVLAEQLIIPLVVRRHDIDVLHYAGTAVSVFARPSDVVTIHHDSTTQRSSMGAIRNFYYDALIWLAGRRGAAIVPTNAYRKELSVIHPKLAGRLVAIHHGTADGFYMLGGLSRSGFGPVIAVTNELPHKNLRGMLEALAILHRSGITLPPVRIAGRVSSDTFALLVDEIDCPALVDVVELLGPLDHPSIIELHKDASCSIFVSHVETFGMPVSEALAAGVPVVASNIAVHEEVSGGAAILVDPADSAAIAEGVRMVIQGDALIAPMVQAGLKRAGELTWSVSARRHLQLYKDLDRSTNCRGC